MDPSSGSSRARLRLDSGLPGALNATVDTSGSSTTPSALRASGVASVHIDESAGSVQGSGSGPAEPPALPSGQGDATLLVNTSAASTQQALLNVMAALNGGVDRQQVAAMLGGLVQSLNATSTPVTPSAPRPPPALHASSAPYEPTGSEGANGSQEFIGSYHSDGGTPFPAWQDYAEQASSASQHGGDSVVLASQLPFAVAALTAHHTQAVAFQTNIIAALTAKVADLTAALNSAAIGPAASVHSTSSSVLLPHGLGARALRSCPGPSATQHGHGTQGGLRGLRYTAKMTLGLAVAVAG